MSSSMTLERPYKFQETGILNQPPTLLRRAQYEPDGNQIRETVNCALAEKLRLRYIYIYISDPKQLLALPVASRSSLNSGTGCAVICGDDPSNLIERPERDDDDGPASHYSLIASANTLMKDASVRHEVISMGHV